MRVLFVSTPGVGHVVPLLPVARALRHAGHHVEWAIPADGQELVAAASFRVHSVGIGVAARGARAGDLLPDVSGLPPRARRPVMFATLFGRIAAPATAVDLAPLVDAMAPDLLVHEAAELASAPLATARDIPHVTVGFGGEIPEAALTAAAEPVAELWASLHLDPPAAAGLYDHCYLHPFPPAFGAAPARTTVHPVRPAVELPGDDAVPAWCGELGRDRPFVYVTFGTEFSPMAPWRAVVDGLGELDVDAVCTVSRSVDPFALGSLPANVRVERFVPQQHVLPRAALVVHHGGSGTMLGAATLGIPQVVLPIGADQFDNADALVTSGAGTLLEGFDPSATAVASAIRAALDAGAVGAAAREVAAQIAAMPDAATLVPHLELLTHDRARGH